MVMLGIRPALREVFGEAERRCVERQQAGTSFPVFSHFPDRGDLSGALFLFGEQIGRVRTP